MSEASELEKHMASMTLNLKQVKKRLEKSGKKDTCNYLIAQAQERLLHYLINYANKNRRRQ